MHKGWLEVCKSLGWDNLYDRTPAREAYEDGWYSLR